VIVEMRTYTLKPGTVAEVESRFGKNLPYRSGLSELGGLWHTVSGQLNTVIHLWPYNSIEERMAIRAEAMKLPQWPPMLREFLVDMDTRIFLPAPFSPSLAAAIHGGLYEFCIDTFFPGGPAEYSAQWPSSLSDRVAISPLVFCGTSELGPLNQWLHIWAYRDAKHREDVHAQLAREKIWPPTGGIEKLRRQEVTLAHPAACSPLR
jgi:NIPSNAP